jgi:hypothetical protein
MIYYSFVNQLVSVNAQSFSFFFCYFPQVHNFYGRQNGQLDGVITLRTVNFRIPLVFTF